jgi:hypothetical protein
MILHGARQGVKSITLGSLLRMTVVKATNLERAGKLCPIVHDIAIDTINVGVGSPNPFLRGIFIKRKGRETLPLLSTISQSIHQQ